MTRPCRDLAAELGRLSHWSAKPLELDPARRYVQKIDFKPFGLWFDVDGDWKRWCESENFNAERLAVRHEVRVDLSRFLWLQNADDIDRFTREYLPMPRSVSRFDMDWPRLASEYAGLIISPYCWQRRMDGGANWYYPWDCASGCCWDLTAIASFAVAEREAQHAAA